MYPQKIKTAKVPAGPVKATTVESYAAVRDVLLRCGMELLTEQGFSATGLEAVLKRATVPKGSFYYYFGSKEGFGLAVLDAYDAYFSRKLDKWLCDDSQLPLERLANFVKDAAAGMTKHNFTRGCLVGNLSQELGALPEAFRPKMSGILDGWTEKVEKCLSEAQTVGHVGPKVDCVLLAEFFWIAWEGAVMRARLVRSARPLTTFLDSFLASQAYRADGLAQPHPHQSGEICVQSRSH